MKVDLEVTAGPYSGTVYRFDRHDTFTVGRSSQARLSMPEDGFLSRDHFLIEFNPPACALRDLGSTNGTMVNGRRVESIRLHDGDEIVAGNSAFVVRVAESSGEAGKVRCVNCASPAPIDLWITPDPGEGRVTWLCQSCKDLRRKHPKTRSDYLIERKIGGGGMGEVYLARHLSTGQPVAIKMMTPAVAASERAKLRFERELDVLRSLHHRKIVEFHEVYDLNGQYQLVMEYVDGKNALAWVGAQAVPLSVSAAASLGVQLLSALHHAHSRGFVHRDIKPSNLLVMGKPERPKVKLSDFGLAKSFVDNAGFAGLTHHGDVGGSSGFISPDHIRDFRQVKEPADIYGAGATLYYLMSGQYPFLNFDPNRVDSYTMVLEHPAVPLRAHRPDVPDAFDRIIRKALEKPPALRWKSAAEMAAALRPFVDAGAT